MILGGAAGKHASILPFSVGLWKVPILLNALLLFLLRNGVRFERCGAPVVSDC